MGILLPCLFVLLVFAGLRRLRPEDDLRETFCLAALVLGLFIAFGTELLNALHLLTTTGVFLFWSVGCAAALALSRLFRPRGLSPGRTSLHRLLAEAGWLSRGMALVIFVFVAVTGLVAWWAVPNNYDSMTYHLSRVIYWRQDHSLAFFPTPNPRQDSMPPLAEWTILHFTFLQGDARSANLVQWLSYAGCIVGVSLLAARCGGTSRTGLLAAFFTATLPAAVWEATSTQNDLVMSFWLLCLANGCLVLARGDGAKGSFMIGAAAGVGVLTKTLVLLFAFPFLVWAFVLLLRRGWREFVPRAVLIGLLALLPNVGHFARNQAAFGNPLGPDLDPKSGMALQTNSIHTPGALVSNIVRNLALHAFIGPHNSVAMSAVLGLHHALGLDPSDPRTTYLERPFILRDLHEDGGPMPLHVAVVLVAFAMILAGWRRQPGAAIVLLGAILANALLFCLILRWQPYHSRFHLPLLILGAPLVALMLERIPSRPVLFIVLILLAGVTVPDVFAYPWRPAIGPHSVFLADANEQQYARVPALREPYVHALDLLREHQIHRLGLISNGNDWEYPLAACGEFHHLWRTDHVLLPPRTASPPETDGQPDALVCTRPGFGDTIDLHGRTFQRIDYSPRQPAENSVPVSVYLPR